MNNDSSRNVIYLGGVELYKSTTALYLKSVLHEHIDKFYLRFEKHIVAVVYDGASVIKKCKAASI